MKDKSTQQEQQAKLQNNQPNIHLVSLLTFIALIPLVYFVPDLIGPYLPENKLIQVIGAVGIIVPIVSYIALPLLLKLFHRQTSSQSS